MPHSLLGKAHSLPFSMQDLNVKKVSIRRHFELSLTSNVKGIKAILNVITNSCDGIYERDLVDMVTE